VIEHSVKNQKNLKGFGMSSFELRKDILSHLLYEADAYKDFEDIEKLVESGTDLSVLPIQPLYIALQTTSIDQVAAILPKLSQDQRQALRDIDMWVKDELDSFNAFYWVNVISKCPSEDVKLEYVKSEDFLLSLKNKCTIQTFDAEDPHYPEGDNYFLTEDNQLLIEYPEDFELVNELKDFVKLIYTDLGPENAYAYLFKMIVDSYQIMEEECYSQKKERLRDLGFVDYFDALENDSTFLNQLQINSFIKSKKGLTGEIDAHSANQTLHSYSLRPYQSGMDDIKSSLEKISDLKRQQFLQFNFIRLVNSRMTLESALKKGSMAMSKVGLKSKQRLELGYDYLKSQFPMNEESIFLRFDFFDLYKIGNSLIEISKRKLKKQLSSTPFESEEFSYFLGMYWNSFIENCFNEVSKYKFDGSSTALEIKDLNSYYLWNEAIETLVEALPFIHTFFKTIQKLKTDGHLNDQFYLNYEIDNIDFESILISSFINFVGGYYKNESAGKMGVTIGELKSFYHQFFIKNGQEYLIKGEEDPILKEQTVNFIKQFGFDQVPRFENYLYQVMIEQLNGYEVDNMDQEDFKHIGGPVILNDSKN